MTDQEMYISEIILKKKNLKFVHV